MALNTLKEITLASLESISNTFALSIDSLKFYQALSLRTSTPRKLVLTPEPIHAVSVERAREYSKGHFKFLRQSLDVGTDGTPWTMSSPSKQFAQRLHGFDWLWDLCALESPRAQKKAVDLVDDWITHFGSWNAFAWQPEILSRRLVSWMAHEKIILAEGAAKTCEKRYKCLARQASYLYRTCLRAPKGIARLEASITLALCGVCLPNHMKMLDRGLDYFEAEILKQTLPDGGHISRNPEALVSLLANVLLLEATMLERGLDTPRFLKRTIDRMAPCLRFFTLSDGGLATFHGSGKGHPAQISRILKEAQTPLKTISYLPQTGFQRIEAGGSVLMVDVGNSSNLAYSQTCHLSALAFEFSSRDSRIIVNCGWSENHTPGWQEIIRKTPAHSTLTLDNHSSGAFTTGKLETKLLGRRVYKEPYITVRRNEKDQGIWLQTRHDGYQKTYGVYHNRNLYVSRDGQDLRGEDRLSYKTSSRKTPDLPSQIQHKPVNYAIRFHLHPSSKASIARDGRSVLIILENGDGWRFRTDSGPLRLEPSIYLSEENVTNRTEQIVIDRPLSAENTTNPDTNKTRWALQKIGKVKPSLQETRAP